MTRVAAPPARGAPAALRALPDAPPPVHGARPPRPARVSRPRLVRRLLAAPGGAVAVLVAPVGYGKTTLLAEWAERDPRPFAWLTLDDDDDDNVARALDALDE